MFSHEICIVQNIHNTWHTSYSILSLFLNLPPPRPPQHLTTEYLLEVYFNFTFLKLHGSSKYEHAPLPDAELWKSIQEIVKYPKLCYGH
jgi:hypothetical protein